MRHLALAACVLGCALVALPGAFAQQPGPIVLGTFAPEGEKAIARGLGAYLQHVNARGGIAGRQLELVVRQAADPESAVQAARELVESDEVFAVVSASGTEEALAARSFLGARGVPQLFVGSGASAFAGGRWSLGFGPSASG